MSRPLIVLSALALLASCARNEPPPPEPVSVSLAWRVAGLAAPESVVLSEDGAVLYVTNVNGEGEAKDGNGFIARLSADGRMLDREWVSGLDAPKGIVRRGNVLYVADIDQIVVIDIPSGAISRRMPIPGARFLNDIAIAPDGVALIADSDAGRIYRIDAETPSIWLEDSLLAAVNGLLPESGRLVVTTMQGRLLAVDYESRAITTLAEGLGEADGVAAMGEGRYLVSEWPGLLHFVTPDGAHRTLLDTRAEGRYLNDFLLSGSTLYQPHWAPGELSAYTLRGVR